MYATTRYTPNPMHGIHQTPYMVYTKPHALYMFQKDTATREPAANSLPLTRQGFNAYPTNPSRRFHGICRNLRVEP